MSDQHRTGEAKKRKPIRRTDVSKRLGLWLGYCEKPLPTTITSRDWWRLVKLVQKMQREARDADG